MGRWQRYWFDDGGRHALAIVRICVALSVLASLVRRVDRDPGTAIAAQQPETMDLTGVQQYLGETGPVDEGARTPLGEESGSADR